MTNSKCPLGCTGPDEGGMGCAAVVGECAMPSPVAAEQAAPELHQVPSDIINAITQYGDARSDDGLASGPAFGNVITRIRSALAARLGTADLPKVTRQDLANLAVYERAARGQQEGRVEGFYAATDIERLFQQQEPVARLAPDAPAQPQPLNQAEPVAGDMLPKIGEKVLIHLASQDAWVEHTVIGYYVWGDHGGNKSLHRVFVQVRDSAGYQNSRMLCDVRPVETVEQTTFRAGTPGDTKKEVSSLPTPTTSSGDKPADEVREAYAAMLDADEANPVGGLAAPTDGARDRDLALEEAMQACLGERVEETGTDSDIAYNTAIDHAVYAIGRLKSSPLGEA